MKKLTFFLLLLGGMLMVWNCNQKPNSNSDLHLTLKPPLKVISIADLALEAMLQSANPKKLDSAWFGKVHHLREMDRFLRGQLESCSQPTYLLTTMSCCACGTGCCKACDTLSNKFFAGSQQVRGISLVSESVEKTSVQFKATSVDSLKVFNLTTKIPDGRYMLKIETSLPIRNICFLV